MRLKTFNRWTMNTGRLTHLALLHVHQDRIDKLDLDVLRKTLMTLYLIICSIKSSWLYLVEALNSETAYY